jgi:5-formyltetrahydrofolate cyclo-ligase
MTDIKTLRQQQRADLIAKREAITPTQHALWSAAITAHLQQSFATLDNKLIGFCWPYRGEYDVRPAMIHFCQRGAKLALPEIVAKQAPMRFLAWSPEAKTKLGAYDIPVPVGSDIVTPQVLILPMLGFDAAGFRLGYGGGYFDRTLATMLLQPLTIGVAFELQRLSTIHPQPHDIAMDFVVTEAGVFRTRRESI